MNNSEKLHEDLDFSEEFSGIVNFNLENDFSIGRESIPALLLRESLQPRELLQLCTASVNQTVDKTNLNKVILKDLALEQGADKTNVKEVTEDLAIETINSAVDKGDIKEVILKDLAAESVADKNKLKEEVIKDLAVESVDQTDGDKIDVKELILKDLATESVVDNNKLKEEVIKDLAAESINSVVEKIDLKEVVLRDLALCQTSDTRRINSDGGLEELRKRLKRRTFSETIFSPIAATGSFVSTYVFCLFYFGYFAMKKLNIN